LPTIRSDRPPAGDQVPAGKGPVPTGGRAFFVPASWKRRFPRDDKLPTTGRFAARSGFA
jgi:hypothetical protein